MKVQFTAHSGDTGNLTGFMAETREKLKKISGEQLQDLAKTDALELICSSAITEKFFTYVRKILARINQYKGWQSCSR